MTQTYWEGVLTNSPIHFEIGDLKRLAEYLSETLPDKPAERFRMPKEGEILAWQ